MCSLLICLRSLEYGKWGAIKKSKEGVYLHSKDETKRRHKGKLDEKIEEREQAVTPQPFLRRKEK